MSRLVQDLRYGGRTLRKSPTFTAVAVLTLALGIGAKSAIFTLINAALLRPLPFPEPERLVLVWEDTSMFGLKDSPVAIGNYVEWRAQNRVFQEMGALEQRTFRLTGTGEAQQIQGSIVTASLFKTLAVQPALGRLFREDEDQPGTPKTAILSDGLWRREFGGDPGIVGRTAEINDESYAIAGVMPAGFRFPDRNNEIWTPVGTSYSLSEFSNKGRHNAMVVARLRPAVSIAQANEEIGAIARRLEREFPRTNARVGAFVAPAIGASRGQVARQLLTENLLLAGGGGLCGLIIAVWGVSFLAKMLPSGIGAMSAVTVDTRVLGFTLAVSLLTGVVFGLAPAFEMLRVDLHQMLKQGGARQGAAGGSRGVRRGLVISEVALAFVLIMGAALFIQSFARLRGIDPGFRTANILTMKTAISSRQYRDPDRRAAFYRQVIERVEVLPGVISAGFTNGIPLVVKGYVNGFTIEGRPTLGDKTFSNANYRVVTQDYLRTIGIPLREGRDMDRHDTRDTPPVVLINEAMKRKFWPSESAIGKRLRFGSSLPWVTVVGVVGDIRQSGLDKPPSPEMYLSWAQDLTLVTGLAIRTKGDPKSLGMAVQREIRAVDKDVPITDVATMEDVLDREVFQRRVQMWLLSIFATVALLLASLGIYGVLAYLISQRTQEIGIRLALGARPRDVLLSVARQGVGLSVAGIALGVAAALALTRVVSKLLFGIAPTDPATFLIVATLLLAVASAASYVPARRAMRIDPILLLREE